MWWRWKHVRNGDEKWWVLAKAKDYNIEKYNSRKPGLSIIMWPTYVRVGGWVVVGCWSKITGISGTNFWNGTVSVAAITRRALKGALQNNCVDWVDQRYLRFIHTVLFSFNRRKPSAPTALLDIITSHTATSCCCWHSTQLLWLVGGWVVTLAAYMTHLGEGFVVFKFKRMADSLPSYVIWVIWWSAHRRRHPYAWLTRFPHGPPHSLLWWIGWLVGANKIPDTMRRLKIQIVNILDGIIPNRRRPLSSALQRRITGRWWHTIHHIQADIGNIRLANSTKSIRHSELVIWPTPPISRLVSSIGFRRKREFIELVAVSLCCLSVVLFGFAVILSVCVLNWIIRLNICS